MSARHAVVFDGPAPVHLREACQPLIAFLVAFAALGDADTEESYPAREVKEWATLATVGDAGHVSDLDLEPIRVFEEHAVVALAILGVVPRRVVERREAPAKSAR